MFRHGAGRPSRAAALGSTEDQPRVAETCPIHPRTLHLTANGWETHIDVINILALVVLASIEPRLPLRAEHHTIGEQTQEHRLGQLHQRFTLQREPLPAHVQRNLGARGAILVHLGRFRCTTVQPARMYD